MRTMLCKVLVIIAFLTGCNLFVDEKQTIDKSDELEAMVVDPRLASGRQALETLERYLAEHPDDAAYATLLAWYQYQLDPSLYETEAMWPSTIPGLAGDFGSTESTTSVGDDSSGDDSIDDGGYLDDECLESLADLLNVDSPDELATDEPCLNAYEARKMSAEAFQSSLTYWSTVFAVLDDYPALDLDVLAAIDINVDGEDDGDLPATFDAETFERKLRAGIERVLTDGYLPISWHRCNHLLYG